MFCIGTVAVAAGLDVRGDHRPPQNQVKTIQNKKGAQCPSP